jgi:hypothetical protein
MPLRQQELPEYVSSVHFFRMLIRISIDAVDPIAHCSAPNSHDFAPASCSAGFVTFTCAVGPHSAITLFFSFPYHHEGILRGISRDGCPAFAQ